MNQINRQAANPNRDANSHRSNKKDPGGPFPTDMDPEPEPKGGDAEDKSDSEN